MVPARSVLKIRMGHVYTTKARTRSVRARCGPGKLYPTPHKHKSKAPQRPPPSPQCFVVLCGALRCFAVLCGALRCSAVLRAALRCSAVLCGALRCFAGLRVLCGALRCSAVLCGASRCFACSAVLCGALGALRCSAVLCWSSGTLRCSAPGMPPATRKPPGLGTLARNGKNHCMQWFEASALLVGTALAPGEQWSILCVRLARRYNSCASWTRCCGIEPQRWGLLLACAQ